MEHNLEQIARHIPADQRPQRVKDALAFEAATAALVEKVASAAPVDLASAQTPKDVATVHAAALAFQRDHDASVEIAASLAKIAADRVGRAWFICSSEVNALLAAEFNTAADDLYAALDALPNGADPGTYAGEHWNPAAQPLRDALATLNTGRQLRDAYVTTWGVGHDLYSIPFEHDSRTLYFDDLEAHTRFTVAVTRVSRDDFYLAAAATEGVRIVWQDKAQQAEQPVPSRVAQQRAAMLAKTSR